MLVLGREGLLLVPAWTWAIALFWQRSLLEQGPVLVLAESEKEIGVIGNAKLNDWIQRVAEEGDIPLQCATSLGYSYTDAAAVHMQAGGIPTAVLGFPRRYSHSPICTFDINDAVNAVRILRTLALESIDLEDLNFI